MQIWEVLKYTKYLAQKTRLSLEVVLKVNILNGGCIGEATAALERLGSQVDRMQVFGARPEEPTQAFMKDLEESISQPMCVICKQ